MRIIGGTAAGLLLKVPKGFDVRPTADLVRQALFNSLASRIPGASVIDLFGGSGALGLECLSRGASLVLCVEKVNRHAAMIRANLEALHLPAENYELRIQDVFTAIGQLTAEGRAFDLILADPPFGEKNVGRRSNSLSQQLLDDERLPRLLAEGGLFVLGHTKRDTLTLPTYWSEAKIMKHGDAMMRFLTAPAP